MRRETARTVEPIVLFILGLITVLDFLIFSVGIRSNNAFSALNAMVALMIFGSTLLIVNILINMYELGYSFFDILNNNNKKEVKKSSANKNDVKKTKSKKKIKR